MQIKLKHENITVNRNTLNLNLQILTEFKGAF